MRSGRRAGRGALALSGRPRRWNCPVACGAAGPPGRLRRGWTTRNRSRDRPIGGLMLRYSL